MRTNISSGVISTLLVIFPASSGFAFHPGVVPQRRFLSSSVKNGRHSVDAGFRARRIRPPICSDTLAVRQGFLDGSHLRTSLEETTDSTVEDSSSETNYDDYFPLKGKELSGCAPRMRFAPSPTGSLHVGGARTALYNWLCAKKGQLDFPRENGAFVIRVEDTDVARSTKESEESVLADLKWLGLTWDEGPDTTDSPLGPYRQSERSIIYKKMSDKLLMDGKAYRCFCTKDEIDIMKAQQEAEGETPRYDGTWRDADPDDVQRMLDEGKPYTIRFRIPAGARVVIDDAVRGTVTWDAESTIDDFILLRSSGIPVYNFCVAVDDATMGITTVIRAEEHLTNTLRQGLVLDALGAPRPRYAHCSLILGEDRQKLSKRHGATSCNQFRLDGFLPDAMVNYLSLLGWNDGTDNEIFSRDELIDSFEVSRVVKSPSIFDMDKLRWVNSQHLKMMPIEETVDLVMEQMDLLKIFKDGADEREKKDFTLAATSLAKQMMETTKDAGTNAQNVVGYGLPASFSNMKNGDAKEMVKRGHFFTIANKLIEGEMPLPDLNNILEVFLDKDGKAIVEDNETGGSKYSFPKSYKTYMKNLSKEVGIKGRDFFHPLRLALTGEMSGQDVTKQLTLLAMASREGGVVDIKVAGVVPFEDRLNQLKLFCDTIPEEYRKPEVDITMENNSTPVPAPSSDSEPQPVLNLLDSYDGPPITSLDIRVGRITKAWEHEEADKLFCEEVDVGEAEPRSIASGLRPYMDASDLEGRMVLVLCNLKERKMLGFPSHGMVLCASNADHTEVKLVNPPPDANIGERVTIPGFNFAGDDATPMAENKIGKKKIFQKIAPFLVTNEYGMPEFFGRPFMTSAGICTTSIVDGTVS